MKNNNEPIIYIGKKKMVHYQNYLWQNVLDMRQLYTTNDFVNTLSCYFDA